MLDFSKRRLPASESPSALDDGGSRISAFDNFARSIGSQTNRRDAIKVGVGGFFALLAAGMGIRPARAQSCLCRGTLYDPATQCCTPTGVQTKRPIADLDACPDRTAAAGYSCTPNGCGAAGGTRYPSRFGAADFLPCCNDHDCCWGECNRDRDACDADFLTCLQSQCDNAYPNGSIRLLCRAVASGYHSAVNSRFATSAYESAQKAACDCCGEEDCQSCPGGTCSSLPSCEDPGCVCFSTVEGTGFCHRPQRCAGLASCTSSSQCPSGWACVSVTCCSGSGAICIQPCFTLDSSFSLSSSSLDEAGDGEMTAPVH